MTVTAEAPLIEAAADASDLGVDWGRGWCQPRLVSPIDDAGDRPILPIIEAEVLPLLPISRFHGWQRHALSLIFAQRSGSTPTWPSWRYKLIVIEGTRQIGKTELTTAIAATAMSMGLVVLYTAQDRAKARRPWMAAARRLDEAGFGALYKGSGAEHLEGHNGSEFWLVTPDDQGPRGHTADVLIVDEAAHVGPSFLAAAEPTMATKEQGQTVLLSTAGWEEGELGSDIRNAAAEALEQMAWAPDERDTAILRFAALRSADPADPETWASCIPTLGMPGGVSVDGVRRAQRRHAMRGTPEVFAREYLTIWTEGNPDTIIPRGLWERAQVAELDAPQGAVTLGIDACNHRDAAIVAAWRPSDGRRVKVQMLRQESGVEWIEGALAELRQTYRIREVICDKRTALDWLDASVRKRVGGRFTELEASGMVSACQRLLTLLQRDDGLQVLTDDRLSESALHAEGRMVADAGFAFRRFTSSEVTASPIMAAAFAVYGIDQRGAGMSIAVAPRRQAA